MCFSVSYWPFWVVFLTHILFLVFVLSFTLSLSMSGSELNIYFYQLYICYHFNFLIHHCSSFLATQNKKGPRLHSQDHSYLSICTYPSLSWAGPRNPWARAEPILTMMGNHSFYRTSPGLSVMAADLKTAWPVEHPAWLATGWGWRPYTGWSTHSLNSTSPNIDFVLLRGHQRAQHNSNERHCFEKNKFWLSAACPVCL